ncbi:MAG: LamG domain-containing protein [Thaumarchaeota archaeon]|nr:LamG domain-containing protein [Nitrososphaerota archaeon]
MKARRGISSVVGMIFAIIALTTTLSYVGYSMDTMERFNQVIMTKGEENLNKIDEEFDIISAETTAAKKFKITVQNTGSLPLNIARLWVENVTDTNWGAARYDLNTQIYPGGSAQNIGENLPLYSVDTQSYKMKLVTERGNSKEFFINSPTVQPLYLQLHTVPDEIPNGFTTTVYLTVLNNMSNNNMLLNLKPEMSQASFTTCQTNPCTLELVDGPTPLSYQDLKSGDVATFRWTYRLSAVEDGDTISFTARPLNPYPGNEVTATTKVKDVEVALESGTSLSSLGVETPAVLTSILIPHEETINVPNGWYQLTGLDTDGAGGGETVDINDATGYTWLTNNGTNIITIPAGTWNASLRYYSDYLPPSLQASDDDEVDMIIHFEENSNDLVDSTAKTAGLDTCGGSRKPTFVSSGGPHGTAYYSFDGSNDCMKSDDDMDQYSDIEDSPDTTALWFKTPTKTDDDREILVRFDEGNTGYNEDFYQISISDDTASNRGKVVFEFDTNNGNQRTKCLSDDAGDDRYDDDQWHHVVAVRDGANACKLYIDGLWNYTQSSTGSSNVDTIDDKWLIGFNGNNGATGEHYDGAIDDIIHWNDRALSAADVTALYNTNFGNSGGLFTISLDKTDADGANPTVIKKDIGYPMKFLDSKEISPSQNSDNSYPTTFNYTVSLPQVILSAQERLKFTIQYDSGMPMNLRFDDTSMNIPDSTYLQMPTPDNIFPSYCIIDNNGFYSVWFRNEGPYGSWFVYQGTRIVFDDPAGDKSYGSIINKVNTVRVDQDQDSVHIPLDDVAELEFFTPQDPPRDDPSPDPPELIPGDKNYLMAAFISGYDEKGKSFLRNISFGLCYVED